MHLFAYWMVGRLCRRHRRRRHGDAGRHHRHAGAVVVAAAVAGDGIGDARLLRALRSRPDPDLAGIGAQSLRGAHRPHRASPPSLIAVLLAAPFINVLAMLGGARWLAAYGVVAAMGAVATAVGARAHHRAVPPDRRQAHAADRADRRGGDRRRLRHRPADRGDLLLRQHVALRGAAIGLDAGARARYRQRVLVAGARRARRSRARSSPSWRRASRCSPPRSRCSRAASATTPWPPPASRSAVVRQRRWTRGFRRRSPARVLRQKEWTLLRRDPWLMSQTLMQILYLLPPALLLWRHFPRRHRRPTSC